MKKHRVRGGRVCKTLLRPGGPRSTAASTNKNAGGRRQRPARARMEEHAHPHGEDGDSAASYLLDGLDSRKKLKAAIHEVGMKASVVSEFVGYSAFAMSYT